MKENTVAVKKFQVDRQRKPGLQGKTKMDTWRMHGKSRRLFFNLKKKAHLKNAPFTASREIKSLNLPA